MRGSIPEAPGRRSARFGGLRRAGLAIAPLAALAALWWAVDTFVLAPPIPGRTATPLDVVSFVASPRGLPRLTSEGRQGFLHEQIDRLRGDSNYRDYLIAALRQASPDDQAAFRRNLFDAFKPIVLTDVQRFHDLPDRDRQAFLDDRIIEYNRQAALIATVKPDKAAFGGALPTPDDWIGLLFERTSEHERADGAAFLRALSARIQEILANPQLTVDFQRRIAEAGP
ncbi:MAG: hypothetical protein U1D55_14845 [Phycisphaerae bacterium]